MHAISYDLNFSIESVITKLIIMQSQKHVKILDVAMMKIIMPQVVIRYKKLMEVGNFAIYLPLAVSSHTA